MKTKLCYLFVLCLILVSSVNATTYYVRQGIGSDEADGLSVGTAFATLQKVFEFEFEDGDVIDIAGFFEFNQSQNITKSITIRGDNKSTTFITGVVGNEGKNCFITGASGTKPDVVMENITFQDFDYFDDAINRDGGVMEFKGGSLICRKVNFINNRAYSGGAFATYAGGTILFEDCYFYNNSSKQRTGATNAHGGVVNLSTGAAISFIMDRCLFEGNSAEGQGAALRLRHTGTGASIIIQNSTFIGNVTKLNGSDVGTVVVESGTGVPNEIKFINNTFAYNSSEKTNASAKAGIRIADNAEGEVTLINNIFFSNYNTADPATSISLDIKNGGLKESRNNITDMLAATFNFDTKTIAAASSGNLNGVSEVDLALATVLADNGGETKTLAIAANSIAVNAGYAGVEVPEIDQTGFTRNTPDIGAYEWRDLSSLTSDAMINKIKYVQKSGTIYFNELDGFNNLKIFSAIGQLIKNTTISDSRFDYSAKSGIYIFLFTDNNNNQQIIKAVLTK